MLERKEALVIEYFGCAYAKQSALLAKVVEMNERKTEPWECYSLL